MKIAFIGIKCLPASSGADRVVEAIVYRLAVHHEITVYCCRHCIPPNACIPGIRLKILPTFRGKYFHATSLFLISALHALIFGQYNLIHLHNVEASFVLPLLRLRYPVISTAHGAPSRPGWTPGKFGCGKWGYFSCRLMALMEYPYIHLSNIRTSVSLIDARYLQTTYKKPVFYIPNGIEEPSSIDHTKVPAMLSECGVDPGDYILFAAGRMVPLKGCHLLLEAYRGLQCYPKLLVVGDLGHVPDYEDRLRRLADARVIFIPLVTDKAVLYGLLRHCRLFVFPSTDEAMSMMLLEAISMGAPVLCSDIPQNTILCKDMLFFKSGDVQDLKEKLSWAIDHMEIMRTQANNARIAVTQLYRWNHIVAEYEHLYAATINPGLAMSTVPSIDRHSTFNDKTAHNLHRIN